jgi:two-component sensor histidine kinase
VNKRIKESLGGYKRIVLLPFLVLLTLGFLTSWGLYLAGSREAVRDLVLQLASEKATLTVTEINAFMAQARGHSQVNASFLTQSRPNNDDPFLLQRIFSDQLKAYPELAIISTGFSDGSYREAQRLDAGTIRMGRAGKETGGDLEFFHFDLSGNMLIESTIQNYDPRTRPWYSNAVTAGAPVWSDLYALYSNSELAVSSAAPFEADDGRSGVSTTVVTMSGISSFLQRMMDRDTGVIVVLDSSGNMIASSLGFESVLASDAGRYSAANHPLPLISDIASAHADRNGSSGIYSRFYHDDERYLSTALELKGSSNRDSPDWSVMVALREQAFNQRLIEADRMTLLLLLALLLLFFLIGWAVVNRITRPIRQLKRVIQNIDPVNPILVQDLFNLSYKRNEIGSLAESFIAMSLRIKKDYNEIRRSLLEKDILLKEVHHRVKNNLQIVSSMLCLQANAIVNPSDRKAIFECHDRVQAMAYVHENAYASDHFSEIHMSGYLRQICEALHPPKGGPVISHSVVPESMVLPLDTAIPCGLIINELITNALKHAFNAYEEGTIFISLEERGHKYILSVRDTGEGKPDGEKKGLGSDLIHALAGQLNGRVTSGNDNGFYTSIVFTIPEND